MWNHSFPYNLYRKNIQQSFQGLLSLLLFNEQVNVDIVLTPWDSGGISIKWKLNNEYKIVPKRRMKSVIFIYSDYYASQSFNI